MRPVRLMLALAFGAATLAGCGSAGDADRDQLLSLPVPTSVTVTTRTVAGLGTVLVDGAGHALYMFPPDARSRVSCTGACAGVWPPLVIAVGRRPTAGGGVSDAELSSVADPNTGARAITYYGYPLYRYSGDVAAGQANGQALFNNRGPWYVLSPAGQPVLTGSGS